MTKPRSVRAGAKDAATRSVSTGFWLLKTGAREKCGCVRRNGREAVSSGSA